MVFMVSMVLVSLFGFYNVRFSILDVFQNDPYPGRLCFKMILIRLCFKMILIRCFKMIRVPFWTCLKKLPLGSLGESVKPFKSLRCCL